MSALGQIMNRDPIALHAQAHPVADLFPLLSEKSEQFLALVGSIGANGLLNPIVLDSQGRVLDGRNRLAACQRAGVEPRFVQFASLSIEPDVNGMPVPEEEYAFSVNFARRDLTDDQRVTICAAYDAFVEAQPRGAPKGNANAAKTIPVNSPELFQAPKDRTKEARALLAKKAGVSEHKAKQALKVKKAAPELAKKVASGEMKLRDAERVVLKREALGKAAVLASRPPPQKQGAPITPIAYLVEKAKTAVAKLASTLPYGVRPHFYSALIQALQEKQ